MAVELLAQLCEELQETPSTTCKMIDHGHTDVITETNMQLRRRQDFCDTFVPATEGAD